MGVDFHQFTIGDKSQGIEGDFDVTDMEAGRIYTPNLPDDTLIARLGLWIQRTIASNR